MSLYESYATNLDAQAQGKWVRDVFRGGIAVKIRSTNAKEVRALQDEISKRNLKYIRRGAAVPQEIQDRNSCDLACACTVEWENVTDATGALLSCTAESKQAIFSDPRISEFRDAVIGTAANSDTYRADLEADLENLSQLSSDGSPAGASAARSE